MATLVFDIATVGVPWDEVSPRTRHVLTRYKTHEDAEAHLGVSPFTGRIVACGLFDRERRQSVVYVTGQNMGGDYKATTERTLLEDFWDGARSYDVFVTFGGRRFDVPFLYHRSLALGIRPSVQFPRARSVDYQAPPYHVDLHDEFTFRGELRAACSLHLIAETYQLKSPDSGALTGETVGEFFRQEKFADLAAYTEATVAATATLYEKWLDTLAPPSFLNTLL